MANPKPNTRVWLTLLLQGGQRESVSLEADSPLFDKLRDMLTGAAEQPWLLQIPIKEGAGLLTVHSSQVVGVITEPPMPLTLQLQAAPAPQERAPLNIHAAGSGFAEGLSPSRAVRIENVLTPEQHKQLVQFATRNKQIFTNSATSSSADNYRESLVCYSFPPFDDLLSHRVKLLAPKVAAQLGLAVPEGPLEVQLTTHNDGHYYRVHNDSSGDGFRHRAISFVYYFHRTPKCFTGGELRIYDRDVKDGMLRPGATWKDIQPLDNSLVFFDSSEMHEVMPVVCPGKVFADGRFTINGWIAKQPPEAVAVTGPAAS